MQPARPWILALALAIIALLLTNFLSPYRLFVVGNIAVLVIVTLGMGLLVGTVGVLSLASPAFLGIGAYGALLLIGEWHWSVTATMTCLVTMSGFIGYLLGLISLRLAGFHLAIVTLGFTSIFLVFLKTGGPIVGNGYGLIAPIVELPFFGDLSAELASRAAIVFSAVVAAAVYCLVHSQIGRAWFALKSNETAAAMLGIQSSKLRALGFAISSAVICLAGTFQGFILGATNPKSYDILTAVSHLALVVVAGMNGSVVGAFLAPVILFLIPDLYPELGHWREVFFGIVLLVALTVRPEKYLAHRLREFFMRVTSTPAAS